MFCTIFLKQAKTNVTYRFSGQRKRSVLMSVINSSDVYKIICKTLNTVNAKVMRHSQIVGYTLFKMLQYENVKIYDPQPDAEIITDLNNYMDLHHYGPWINELLVNRMSQEMYRVTTLDEIKANNARIEELAAAFVP